MLPFKKGGMLMRILKRCMLLFLAFFIITPMAVSTKVEAEEVKEIKTGFPDKEVFTPGEWF